MPKPMDFRTTDLIDQLDWNDPRVHDTVAMLMEISEVQQAKLGQRTVRFHVINVPGEPSIMPAGNIGNLQVFVEPK